MNDNQHQIKHKLKFSRHYYAHNNKKRLNYYSRYSPKRNKIQQQNQSPLTDRCDNQNKKKRKLSQNFHQGQKFEPMFELIGEQEVMANNKIQEMQGFQAFIYENRGQIFIDEDEQEQNQNKKFQQKKQQTDNRRLLRADKQKKSSSSESYQRFVDDSHYKYSGKDEAQIHQKWKTNQQIILTIKNTNDSIYILDDDQDQDQNYENLDKKLQQKMQKYQKNKNLLGINNKNENLLHQPSKSQNQSFSIESDLCIIQQKWNSLFEDQANQGSIESSNNSFSIQKHVDVDEDYIVQKMDNHSKQIQQQKLPSFQTYLEHQQTKQQSLNFKENDQNKILNRHFTFGSQIQSPEIVKKDQQESQNYTNLHAQNQTVQNEKKNNVIQHQPLLKKLFSTEFTQKIIQKDNIKKSKQKSGANRTLKNQNNLINFKKEKNLTGIQHYEEAPSQIKKKLFKQTQNKKTDQEIKSNKKQSGINTQRSTGQTIQLMSDQIKKFQEYPFQPQNLKISKKKHDKLLKEERWQKTIHQLLQKRNSINEAKKQQDNQNNQKSGEKSKNNKNQNSYSYSNFNSNQRSQISSVKARNSSQNSQIFSNQQEKQDLIVNQKQKKQRQPIEMQMMLQNEVEDYSNVSFSLVDSSQRHSDLKDSQTDDMSRRIKIQRQNRKYKSLQQKQQQNQKSFDHQPETITKTQNYAQFPSTYTQIFLKKLNRPHKKSVEVQESIIFVENQSQQKQKNKSNMFPKGNEEILQQNTENQYKKELKRGKDKKIQESFEIQGQTIADIQSFQKNYQKFTKQQKSQKKLKNKEFEKQLNKNIRSPSFKYIEYQKNNQQDQLQKSFQQSKSFQLLRETVPTLPTELVNTYLTIYNKLLVTQAQHQARKSRQKMLLDILQMLIYFYKRKIDCESFLIQPFQENTTEQIKKFQNEMKKKVNTQTQMKTNQNDQASEEQRNQKEQFKTDLQNNFESLPVSISQNQKFFKDQARTIEMNKILLRGMIKQLASKII